MPASRRTKAGTTVLAAISVLLLAPLSAPAAQAAQAAPAAQHRADGQDECSTPSINRLQKWLASGEGTTVPPTGSLLVPEGDGYAAKIAFQNNEWHVAVVWLGNQFDAQADLSHSAGFWLTYSADDDFYVQLRPASHWSGGDKWLTRIPSTGGQLVRTFFPFDASSWTWLPELGQPQYTFASALTEARGLVFVGKTPNSLDFRELLIDGYQPPCL
ncbi:hypothetical protein [Amycolatopsis dendrobii]|uniref:DUF1349 domain-containing protein n=1 Tax=Amycolatopsis dendrobii TaxID=2760662 RepID=A0A7W3VRL5_9PSEU|nr:hypothetical protein [Amycolatopsis dendrobii]MBB1151938.1 hypothetical protein [Amycolatopsis dendrobii]